MRSNALIETAFRFVARTREPRAIFQRADTVAQLSARDRFRGARGNQAEK